ncbi:MAG: DDE-type integrase/transposase/recombinase [Dehalococcoidales bacterium]|nr:DDE-type integrase/transposase/recombinase [Dehalococcoidales bacterium]
MAFIRSKEIPPHSGNWYDYEVKSVNENGKIRQKHIRYIGKSGTRSGVAGGHSEPLGVRDTISLSPAIRKTACKFCGSQHTRKFGTYKGIQNYYCDDCRTKFTDTDALPHGRVSPSFIAGALNQFYNGASFHDIEADIDQRTNEGISHTAIIKWVNKYTADAVKATKDLKPNVGNTWIADETFVRVDKKRKGDPEIVNPYSKSRKAKWVVFWDIIDAKTRFLLASHLATTRGLEDARILMEKAQKRAGKTPKVVVTDHLKSYIEGIERAYGSETIHKHTSAFEVRNDNNLIERFHGSLKERTKVMRAQKNRSTLQRFTDGWLVHYNFFRPHMSLDNRPPAEAAGLKCDKRTWAEIVGVEKEPIVKPLTPTGDSA